jgi:Protein of unknown function (DUF3631)
VKNLMWEELEARIARRRLERHSDKESSGLADGMIVAPIRPAALPAENIVDSIIAFLRRFVFLKDEELYLLVAVWIIATYMYPTFDYAGYLFAYSPEHQSGISPTPAILFRTADGKTQLLDEIDTWMNHDELRSFLNAGFQKGAKVSRMDKGPKSGLKAQEFQVYGPKALAGIGFNKLSQATRDRMFALPMVRQKKGEKRERFKLRLVQSDAYALQTKIGDWVGQKRELVSRIYNEAKFPYLEQFGDRTMDIADPLAAIVEAAFEGDSRGAAQAKLVEAIRITRNEQQSATSDHRILRHLLELTETADPLVANPSELAKMCGNLAEPPNKGSLGHMLRNYGFEPESRRKTGEVPKYRYVLYRRQLQELVERWAGEPEKTKQENEPAEASDVVDVVAVVAPPQENQGQEAKDPG